MDACRGAARRIVEPVTSRHGATARHTPRCGRRPRWRGILSRGGARVAPSPLLRWVWSTSLVSPLAPLPGLEARAMIIDDIRLNDANGSNDRDGFASDALGPDLSELAQINVEAEAEPTAPTPTSDPADAAIDSPLGIYFRDIARIPLLTAEQEVDLAQKLERGELAKQRLRIEPPEDR